MGQGGQQAQLKNIERVQTQLVGRASKLAAATANEPLNPMAPMAIDASNGSFRGTVSAKH